MATIIEVQEISHEQQRYNTAGDWQFDSRGKLIVKISDTGSRESNILIAIHEIIEAILCKKEGISQEIVDKWDLSHQKSEEPGMLRGCPYFMQHVYADVIERMLARYLEVKWKEHEVRVNSL